MLARLFPRQIGNAFHGSRIALWLLGVLLFVQSGISAVSILNGYSAASQADGIPLERFSAEGAATVVALFGLLGVSQLMLRLLGVLALVRYRAAVPLVYLTMVLELVARRLVLVAEPIVRRQESGGGAGFPINLVMLLVSVAGLGLALWPSRSPQT